MTMELEVVADQYPPPTNNPFQQRGDYNPAIASYSSSFLHARHIVRTMKARWESISEHPDDLDKYKKWKYVAPAKTAPCSSCTSNFKWDSNDTSDNEQKNDRKNKHHNKVDFLNVPKDRYQLEPLRPAPNEEASPQSSQADDDDDDDDYEDDQIENNDFEAAVSADSITRGSGDDTYEDIEYLKKHSTPEKREKRGASHFPGTARENSPNPAEVATEAVNQGKPLSPSHSTNPFIIITEPDETGACAGNEFEIAAICPKCKSNFIPEPSPAEENTTAGVVSSPDRQTRRLSAPPIPPQSSAVEENKTTQVVSGPARQARRLSAPPITPVEGHTTAGVVSSPAREARRFSAPPIPPVEEHTTAGVVFSPAREARRFSAPPIPPVEEHTTAGVVSSPAREARRLSAPPIPPVEEHTTAGLVSSPAREARRLSAPPIPPHPFPVEENTTTVVVSPAAKQSRRFSAPPPIPTQPSANGLLAVATHNRVSISPSNRRRTTESIRTNIAFDPEQFEVAKDFVEKYEKEHSNDDVSSSAAADTVKKDIEVPAKETDSTYIAWISVTDSKSGSNSADSSSESRPEKNNTEDSSSRPVERKQSSHHHPLETIKKPVEVPPVTPPSSSTNLHEAISTKSSVALQMDGPSFRRATLTEQDLMLTDLSKEYDNLFVAPSNVIVEPIGSSVSVTNTTPKGEIDGLDGSPTDNKKRRSSAYDKRKRSSLPEVNLYRKKQYHICHKCHKIVEPGDEAFHLLSGFNTAWHKRCFRCTVCGRELSERDHSFLDNEPYCMEHYIIEAGVPKCFQCGKLITESTYTTAAGHAWHRTCFACHSCNKPLVDTKYVLVHGKHPYCFHCHETVFPKYCRTCGGKISPLEPYVQTGDLHWHSNDSCLQCSTCKRSLVGRSLLFRKDGHLYCNRYCAVHEVEANIARF